METTNTIAAAEMTDEQLQEHGRNAATRYLEMMGHTVLDRDWSCRWGGVRIVIRDSETDHIAFVEVKTRHSIEADMPGENASASRQRELERVAMSWMVANEVEPGTGVRFDCIVIARHVQNAGAAQAPLQHLQRRSRGLAGFAVL